MNQAKKKAQTIIRNIKGGINPDQQRLRREIILEHFIAINLKT